MTPPKIHSVFALGVDKYTFEEVDGNISNEDFRRISEIFLQSFTHLPHNSIMAKKDADNITKKLLDAKRKGKEEAVLCLARREGNIVGFSFGERYDPAYHDHKFDHLLESGRYYHLHGVFVDETVRREGISTKLTSMRIDHAKLIGCTHALSDTRVKNKPRISQFLKEGFTPLKYYFDGRSGQRAKWILFHRRL